MSEMPEVGTRETCAACGKVVWLRRLGTMGWSATVAPGSPCYQWVARKGTKPAPARCPIPDGYPSRSHKPRGREVIYYGEPQS